MGIFTYLIVANHWYAMLNLETHSRAGLGGCRNWLQPGLYLVVDYRNLVHQYFVLCKSVSPGIFATEVESVENFPNL